MPPIFEQIKAPAIALLVLCATAGALWWLSYSVEDYGETLKQRMQAVVNDAAFEERYVALIDTAATAEADLAVLNGFILKDDRDTIELLSALDQIAAEQNVELATSQLDESTAEEGEFNTLTLSYAISGREPAVMQMIKILETLPYHGQVTSLRLSRSNEAETGTEVVEALIALELTIRNYD